MGVFLCISAFTCLGGNLLAVVVVVDVDIAVVAAAGQAIIVTAIVIIVSLGILTRRTQDNRRHCRRCRRRCSCCVGIQ